MAGADELGSLRELAADVAPAADEAALMASPAALLPAPHLNLLRQLNGMTVCRGAFRLLGVRPEPYLDLEGWNAPETWRFAWADKQLDEFLMFGETAWGDQYAYRRVDSGAALHPQVYFLEAYFLNPEVIAESFEEFLAKELIRNARQPYSSFTRAVLEHRGGLAADRHWALAPSVALGGPEVVENVIELPAPTAMTYAGDIATAIDAAPPAAVPTAVVPWTDDRGRPRLRTEFA